MAEGHQSFAKMAAQAASILKEAMEKDQEALVLTHLDADGLASAGIIASVLARDEKPFMVRVVNQLSQEDYEFLAKHKGPIVMTDLGSGYLDEIGGIKSIFVIDHHMPRGKAGEGTIHVNPHLCGIDGTREMSASGATYLVAREYDGSSSNLAAMAIVGALGDMQDKVGKRALTGANEAIVREAEESGVLEVMEDLIFFGRESRPMYKSISVTTEPYLPGLSGEDDAVIALLVKAGIALKEDDRWRTIGDLTVEEKQNIFAAVMQKLISDGFDTSGMLELTGKVYTLVKEDRWTPLRDAREFATLLNACGRLSRQGIAIALCMGERGRVLQESMALVEEYRRATRQTIEKLLATPGAVNMYENFTLLSGEGIVEEKMLGAIASILSASPIMRRDKPLFATALLDDKRVRVSGRADGNIIDVGRIMSEASSKVGGIGGGHDAAAGATIPRKKVVEFFEDVSRMVAECEKRSSTQS